MTTPSSGPGGFRESEPALGGADAVPDTVQASGHGTEPNAARDGDATARVKAGGGMGVIGWVVAVIAVGVLVVYLLGAF